MKSKDLDQTITTLFAETIIAYAHHNDEQVTVARGTMSSIIIGDKALSFYICTDERHYWDAVEKHLTDNALILWKSSSVFMLTTSGELQAERFTAQNNIDFTQDLSTTLKQITGGVLFKA